jgi:RNA polymerase sigma factor (sigma-70 family)
MTSQLAHLRRGERAFERLYRRHVGDVYRYALAVLCNPDQAERVTRETFIEAHCAFGSGGCPPNARAWVLTLAHRACRERAGLNPSGDEEAATSDPEQELPTPAEVRRALFHLPFDAQAALVLRDRESRSYAEIADVLEVSPRAVETLVFEARRSLREGLDGALRCHQAERAISRQIDGRRLARSERKPLKRHLRACADCARFARSQRVRRSAWKQLAGVPLPRSLRSFFGPDGVMARTSGKSLGVPAPGLAAKAVAVAAIGVSALGVLDDRLGPRARSATVDALNQQVPPLPLPPLRKLP